MSTIVGLFQTSEQAETALQAIRLAGLGVCVEDIRVAGRRLECLELYQREHTFQHESTRSTDSVLVAIRSEVADFIVLRERLVAAGMEVLETDPPAPREYSRYPYGDGVERAASTGAGETPPPDTLEREALDRDWY